MQGPYDFLVRGLRLGLFFLIGGLCFGRFVLNFHNNIVVLLGKVL